MLDRDVRSDSEESRARPKRPGHALLRAAMSGLLGVGGTACADDKVEEPDPEITDRGASTAGRDNSECKPEGNVGGAGAMQAGSGAGDTEVDKIIGDVETKQYTFAQLSKMCDDRGGYIQTHASCPGLNTCRGFNYGDWEETSELQEHSCSGTNGCAGLSCVDMLKEPEEGGLSGDEIMKLEDEWFTERAGSYGPKACKTCHVPSEKHHVTGEPVDDVTKLRLLFWPGDGRDASNWKERPAKYQEAVIAFGSRGIRPDGTAYSNMVSYKDLLSRAEIERVVKYMRDFAPADTVVEEIKEKPGLAE